MTAITRRLCRLEARFVPPDDPEGRRLIEQLRGRQRHWAEANGQTSAPAPREDLTGMAVVDILRARFNGRPAK
jgi:hypothetical protein